MVSERLVIQVVADDFAVFKFQSNFDVIHVNIIQCIIDIIFEIIEIIAVVEFICYCVPVFDFNIDRLIIIIVIVQIACHFDHFACDFCYFAIFYNSCDIEFEGISFDCVDQIIQIAEVSITIFDIDIYAAVQIVFITIDFDSVVVDIIDIAFYFFFIVVIIVIHFCCQIQFHNIVVIVFIEYQFCFEVFIIV